MRGLKDKVIILTGAAGGLGQAIAKRLTQEQAYPVLVDHNQSALLELSEDRSLNHPLCLSGDIANPEFITTIMAEAIEKYGKINGLVNSAAILLPDDGDISQTPLPCWLKTMEAVRQRGSSGSRATLVASIALGNKRGCRSATRIAIGRT